MLQQFFNGVAFCLGMIFSLITFFVLDEWITKWKKK